MWESLESLQGPLDPTLRTTEVGYHMIFLCLFKQWQSEASNYLELVFRPFCVYMNSYRSHSSRLPPPLHPLTPDPKRECPEKKKRDMSLSTGIFSIDVYQFQ